MPYKDPEKKKQYAKEHNAKWQKENKEYRKEYNKKWLEDNKNHVEQRSKEYEAERTKTLKRKLWVENYNKTPKRRFGYYIRNAKKANRIFELTFEQFENIINKNCTYCDGPGFGIDRIDSKKGYEKDNIVSCCSLCNQIKMDLTLKEMEEHITKMYAVIQAKK